MEFYVFSDQAGAQACIDYINSTPWFPIVGAVNGVPAPDKQMTTCWCDTPRELVSGEWVVPRIPTSKLDALEVPQEDRDAFLAAFGQDIRSLLHSDFVVIEEEEL